MIVYDAETNQTFYMCDNCDAEILEDKVDNFNGKHYCSDCLEMFSFYNDENDSETV